MERQGALENALMQQGQARAEAEQRLSVALGEVGGRADAAVATAAAGVSSSSMTGCIDTRILVKPDKFDGQDPCEEEDGMYHIFSKLQRLCRISGEPTEFEWNIFQGFDTLQLYDIKSKIYRADQEKHQKISQEDSY